MKVDLEQYMRAAAHNAKHAQSPSSKALQEAADQNMAPRPWPAAILKPQPKVVPIKQ